MNEVTKLYENANIKPDCTYLFLVDGNGENEAARTMSIGSKADLKRLIVDCSVKGRVIKSTNTLKPFYPPFTAEKQLLLLQLLARIESADYFQFFFYEIKQEWVFRLNMLTELSCESAYTYESRNKDFTEAFAGLVNILWQDLTEEERKQIKEILE